jgi:hypothetical protein
MSAFVTGFGSQVDEGYRNGRYGNDISNKFFYFCSSMDVLFISVTNAEATSIPLHTQHQSVDIISDVTDFSRNGNFPSAAVSIPL